MSEQKNQRLEADRRIEAARQEADRQKQTKEFLDGLTRNDEIVKPIYNPEAFIMRDKAQSAARRGEVVRKDCKHPLEYLQQYLDDDPLIKRKGRPVNLFACGICGGLIWFVDAWGTPVSDG